MSKTKSEKMDAARFVEITRKHGWASIDEMVNALDRAGFWDDEFEQQAQLAHKKNYVRRHVRKIVDDTGWPIIASVVTPDEQGNPVRMYKQETLFEVGDYKQVVEFHKDRGKYHAFMANGYAIRCREKLGVQMPLPFAGLGQNPAA